MLSLLLSLTSIFKVHHFRKLIKGQFYRWRNLHKVFQVISGRAGARNSERQTSATKLKDSPPKGERAFRTTASPLPRDYYSAKVETSAWLSFGSQAQGGTGPHTHATRVRESKPRGSRSVTDWGAIISPKWCLLRCQSPFFPIPPLLHDQRPQIPPRGQRQHVEPEPPTPGYTELRSACRRSCFGRRIVAAMLSRATPTTGTGGDRGRSVGLWLHPFLCPQSLDVRPLGTFQDGSPHSEAVVSCGAESASASALLGRLVAVLLLWGYFFSHLRALP